MYRMDDTLAVAKQAAMDIEAWLQQKPETVSIQNVELEPAYQKIDVDLIWTTHQGSYQVEIKGDRYPHTGNFFFETDSNKEKRTQGCFLYTQADLLFYYFIKPCTLYILPMPATRDWFLGNMNRFREKPTRTSVGNNYYTTVGRLVPIAVVMAELQDIKQEQIA